MSKRILAIYPHPDDETFVSAGTLIQHVEAEDKVTVVIATLGQMGRRMGNPFFANRETLVNVRERELQDACDAIGITDLRLWRMQDKTLQFRDSDMLADYIMDIMGDVNPDIIYSFYPEHGVHPDHDTLSAATVLAVSRLEPESRPEIRGHAITDDTLAKPDLEIDVTNVIDKKMAALRAHKSQTEIITRKLDEEIRKQPEKKEVLLSRFAKEAYWIYKFPDNNTP